MATVLLLASGIFAAVRLIGDEPPDACSILPAADVNRVLGVGTTTAAFKPQGASGTTGCFYRGSGVDLTIFVGASGGSKMLRRTLHIWEQEHVRTSDLSDAGYRAYETIGPRAGSESALIVRGDRFANVVVLSSQPVAILVPPVGRRLGS